MAAGLGFKTFAVGEVLTAADTNGYLMQGVLVFASAAARDAAITSPQEGQFAYLKDTNVTTYYTGSAWANLDTTGMVNPMTTTGDTIYSSSGSTPARLGIGTAGQVLRVNSGATAPEWAAAAAGGKLLQVVRSTDSSSRSTSSTSFVDVTGVSVTITPTSATSNILLVISGNFMAASSTNYVAYRITNSSNVAISGCEENFLGPAQTQSPFVLMAYASPATTSAVTYKLQFKTENAATTADVRGDRATTQFFALELGV